MHEACSFIKKDSGVGGFQNFDENLFLWNILWMLFIFMHFSELKHPSTIKFIDKALFPNP